MESLEFLGVRRRKDLEKAADDSYVVRRDEEEPKHRPVLGASDLSGGCDRKVWYTWRHTKSESFKNKGQTLRLFEVGHRQEPIFARDLAKAGVKISTHRKDGGQHRFALFGGHFAVNLDGLALVPNEDPMRPGYKMIVEMKTVNDSNFEELQSQGMRKKFPGYYRQMQAQAMAMRVATGELVDGFLFVAVNKNTSKYHFEVVDIDDGEQRAIWHLLMDVIQKDAPAPVLNISPDAVPCRWCNYKKICREGRTDQVEKSCRSCAYGEPVGERDYKSPGPVDGDPPWRCNRGREFGNVCEEYNFDSRY